MMEDRTDKPLATLEATAGNAPRSPGSLLRYRAWRGEFKEPIHAVLPIARTALTLIFRRKLFWVVYSFGLLMFLMFFFGQYMLSWAEGQAGEQTIKVAGVATRPEFWIHTFRKQMKINGTGEMYRNFIGFQGYMVMIVLAMAGSILVGNDFQFRSMSFYLSKPIRGWHYVLGKCLAVGVFVNLMTTLPALILFVQWRTLEAWGDFADEAWLVAGILGYGLLLTVFLSLVLVATATWLRRTVPLIMAWTTLFFFLRMLANSLVHGLDFDARWRLIDLWNNTYLVGNYLLGLGPDSLRQPQPACWEAALVLGAVSILCLIYLNLRIRAVEIVS